MKKTNTNIDYFSMLKNFALDKVRKMKKPYSIRKPRKRASVILSKNIKNDHCEICLREIQEKYTLVCGDYFCRECLYEMIKSILNCISDFDKIRCHKCKEPIEENTLKRFTKGYIKTVGVSSPKPDYNFNMQAYQRTGKNYQTLLL